MSVRTPPPMYIAPSFPVDLCRHSTHVARPKPRDVCVLALSGYGRCQRRRRDVMPPRGVKKGSKRARQYEHVKDSVLDRGGSEDEAEEIARAYRQQGTRAQRRGAGVVEAVARGHLVRSARWSSESGKGPRGRTRDQLYEEAKHRNIRGRSRMTQGRAPTCARRPSVTSADPARETVGEGVPSHRVTHGR